MKCRAIVLDKAGTKHTPQQPKHTARRRRLKTCVSCSCYHQYSTLNDLRHRGRGKCWYTWQCFRAYSGTMHRALIRWLTRTPQKENMYEVSESSLLRPCLSLAPGAEPFPVYSSYPVKLVSLISGKLSSHGTHKRVVLRKQVDSID